MGAVRRLAGVVALVLSAVGIAGCVGGAVAVWRLSRGVSERVQQMSIRIDEGLRRVSAANRSVRRALGKARADVASVRSESARLDRGSSTNRRVSRALQALIQQQVSPDIDELAGRLATLSDTAVAAAALLGSLEELTANGPGGFNGAQLGGLSDQAQQLTGALRRLEAAVGNGNSDTGGQGVAAATSNVDLVLQRCQATLDDWQSGADAARDQLSDAAATARRWWVLGAAALTFLLVWMAAGQVGLFAHALRWCRAA